MSNGAVQLKNIINRLQRRGMSSGVVVSPLTPELVRIEKRTSGSEKRPEFAFTVRIEQSAGGERWWPIEYLGSSGESLCSETIVHGRTLTNLQRQAHLVELAETWARTLEAQLITKTVGNVLL